jgi:hypothetical protein
MHYHSTYKKMICLRQKPKKLRKYYLCVILIFAIGCSGNLHLVSVEGIVVDLETGEPIVNALVLARYYSSSPSVAGTMTAYIDAQETYTDSHGRFHLPKMIKQKNAEMFLSQSWSRITVFKSGYFHFSQKPYSKLPNPIQLLKKTHNLNYLPYRNFYKTGRMQYWWDTGWEAVSSGFQTFMKEEANVRLKAASRPGLFLRVPGKRFTKIITQDLDSLSYSAVFSKKFQSLEKKLKLYHAYDIISKEWFSFDDRGKAITLNFSGLPRWTYITACLDFDLSMVCATHDEIFIPYMKAQKDSFGKIRLGIKTVRPAIGMISGIAGNFLGFYTIEDNGVALCVYWTRCPVDENGGYTGPCLKKMVFADQLISPAIDDSVNDGRFKYVKGDSTYGHVVIETPRAWHIVQYNYEEYQKIMSFGKADPITAFDARENRVIIGFGSGRIRSFIRRSYLQYIENSTIWEKSVELLPSPPAAIAIGSAVNMPACYIVTGEDTIYRFGIEGTPDFKIMSIESSS